MTMKCNTVFICAFVISVSGQFIKPEYSLDSAPLPISRRTNSAPYDIQPSVGRQIQYSEESAKLSNQGRRHIDNNHRSNLQNGQNKGNMNSYESKPHDTIHQTDNRNFESRPLNSPTNKRQDNIGSQFGAGLSQQIRENQNSDTNIHHDDRNNRNLYQNFGNEDPNLKTNLNNPRNNQGNVQNQPNYSLNHNIRRSENTENQQNVGQNYNNQQSQNNRANDNTENISRHAVASPRAIDNSYSKQSIDTTNSNRNYYTKPSRQTTETTREYNRNYGSQTTEPYRINTGYDKSFAGETKSTEDNELSAKSPYEGRIENKEDEKWIWSSENEKTTKAVDTSTPTVDDRAAFSGDKCPTGQVRFNNRCVNID